MGGVRLGAGPTLAWCRRPLVLPLLCSCCRLRWLLPPKPLNSKSSNLSLDRPAPLPAGDLSKNNWWVGILAWGEGWHNNHHAFEFSARHGLEDHQIDVTWKVRLLRCAALRRALLCPMLCRAVAPCFGPLDPFLTSCVLFLTSACRSCAFFLWCR